VIDHLITVRIPYLQEYRRKCCRNFETTPLFAYETVCIQEVDVSEAPVAYVISNHSGPGGDFIIRSHRGGFWWPVTIDDPLTPANFKSLAYDGDKELISALGVKHEYGHMTLEDFERETPLRDLGESTLEDAKARLHKGASQTINFRGRVLFEAGPPAYFRPYHEKKMVIGPLGVRGDDYGNDDRIPGPPRHTRSDCGGVGTVIGLDEVEVERSNLPDGLYVPEVGETIEIIQDLTPDGAAALYCEREFPKKLRTKLAYPYGWGPERTKLFESIGPDLQDWVKSTDTPASTRWLLRRCAHGEETAFKYEFHSEARAAQAILRRLKKYGLESEFEEADEIAMQQLSEMP
jgi:hypothetical protein